MLRKLFFSSLILLVTFWANAQENAVKFRDKLKLQVLGLNEKSSDAEIAKKLLSTYRSKANIYLNVENNDVSAIKKEFPSEVASSIEVANQVCNQYFLFRYEWDMERTNVPYQFKKDIIWNLLPTNDVEWCFMLNRHRYWVDLGKAYFLTKDEKYAKTWVKQTTDWIKKNPVTDKSLHPLTWRRIEAGIRCENWIKTFEYIKNSSAVTPEFIVLFLNSLSDHAEFIDSEYKNHSLISNWGIFEFQGLLHVSCFFTEAKKAEEWKKSALDKIEKDVIVQILPDGTQWEQSPSYHHEVFHCLTNVVYLAQKLNFKIDDVIKNAVSSMAQASVKSQKPNYFQPLTGDSDDTDLRAILTNYTALYNDEVVKSRSFSSLDYESLFQFGFAKGEFYKSLKSVLPNYTSAFLQSSGDFYMRSSWDENASYASFHIKKIGDGHAHDNLLHFNLFANKKDYLVDGGRYTYVEGKEREYLKSSAAHNLLSVDDLTNAVYKETWENKYNGQSEGAYTKVDAVYDYSDALNDSYMRLSDPVMTKRRVLYLKPDVWLIFDSFYAKEKHKYSLAFNFPDKQIAVSENEVKTTYSKDNLVIKAINPAQIDVKDAYWSPEYNVLVPNKKVEFYKNSTGFDSFISLLYFPEKTEVSCKKIKVDSYYGNVFQDKYHEAVELKIGNKEYIVVVTNHISAPFKPIYFIKGTGYSINDVLLLEKTESGYKRHIVKE